MDFLHSNLGNPSPLAPAIAFPAPPLLAPAAVTVITPAPTAATTTTGAPRSHYPLRRILLIRQHTLLDGIFHLRSCAVPEDTKLVVLVDESNAKVKADLPNVIARVDFGQARFACVNGASGQGVWPPLLDANAGSSNVASLLAGDMRVILAQVGARDQVAGIVRAVDEAADRGTVAVALVGDFELTYAERNRLGGSGRKVVHVPEYEDLVQVCVDLSVELATREGREMLVEVFKSVLRALDESFPSLDESDTDAEPSSPIILDSRTLLSFLHTHLTTATTAATGTSFSCITPGLLLTYLVRTRALIPTDAAFTGSEIPNRRPTPAIDPVRGLLYIKSDEYMSRLLTVASDTTGRLRFDSLPRVHAEPSSSTSAGAGGPQLPNGQVVESTSTSTSILTYPDMYPDAKNPISVLIEYFQQTGAAPPKIEAVPVGSMGGNTQMYVGLATFDDGEQMQGVRALPKKKLAEQDVCKVALVRLGIVRPSPQLVMVMRAGAGREGQVGVTVTGGCGVVQGAAAGERAATTGTQSAATHSHTVSPDPSSSSSLPRSRLHAAIPTQPDLTASSTRPLLAKALQGTKPFDSALFEHFALATPRLPEPSLHVYSTARSGQGLFGCTLTMEYRGQVLVIEEPAVHVSRKLARDAAARKALVRIGVI